MSKISFASFLKNGSGWILKEVVRLDITVNKLRSLKGSSYIPLTHGLSRSRGLINIKNKDQECFKWAVTRALNPVDKNPQRITKIFQEQANDLDWSGIEIPTPCTEKMFKKFEKNNNVTLLVFGDDGDDIIPLYI